MICFYHNDLDGHCSGAIVRMYEQKYNGIYDGVFIESDYSGLDISQVPAGETVYIVDYSFTENTVHYLYELIDRGCEIIWIDHHQSSLDLIENHPELDDLLGIRSNEASGAALTYMYLYDVSFQELPYFIMLVSDYDTWTHEYPDSDTFKLGMDATRNDVNDDIWDVLSEDEDAVYDIIEDGEIIQKYIDNDNAEYLRCYGFEASIDGIKVYAVNKSSNSWIFGDKINEYDAVIAFVFNGDQYKYSLFSSKHGANCQKIAESHGGGGHKHAAGFLSDTFDLEID